MSRIKQFIGKTFLDPALHMANRIRYENTPDLSKTQWWKKEQLDDFQNSRLRSIVSYVYKNVPGYYEKMKAAGVIPEHIQTVEDLKRLPITTREEIQQAPEKFIVQKRVTGTLYTGGSTGKSLKYFESFESAEIRRKVHYRGWEWGGYIPDKKRLLVLASSQGNVFGEKVLNLKGDLTAENLDDHLHKILEFKPEIIRAYVSSVYIMALHCKSRDVYPDFVKGINCISENLYDYQRKAIEEVFGCPVFEEYVCNDGGASAWECEKHEGLHYSMERAVIESVDGEMVVTDLWNKAMPFIRYTNGDSVTFLNRSCSCKRKLPLIRVAGRSNDILITPNGPVSPTYIMHTSYGLPFLDSTGQTHAPEHLNFVKAAQFIQKPGFCIEVNVVCEDGVGPAALEDYEQSVRKLFPGMTISIQQVKALKTTPKGKRQFIVNEDNELLAKYGYGRSTRPDEKGDE